MPVVVENAETLDENEYLIPPKEQKLESDQCFEVNRHDRKWVLFAHANPLQCPFNSLSKIYLDLMDGPGH